MAFKRTCPLLCLLLYQLLALYWPIVDSFVLPATRTTPPSQCWRRRPSATNPLPEFIRATCSSSSSSRSRRYSSSPDKYNPVGEKRHYDDSLIDRIWITLFGGKIAAAVNAKVPGPLMTYDDFVDLSQMMMRGGPTTVRNTVLRVLRSIAFPGFSSVFRFLFPGSARWAAEFNAEVTPIFFSWLVGPATVEEKEIINVKTGQSELWRSTVKIERCRYLENSGCKGSCINICKIPTQEFFTKDLGMPVTMTPDFQTLGCTMTFGQSPLPLEEDPVSAEKCFASCPTAQLKNPVAGYGPPPDPLTPPTPRPTIPFYKKLWITLRLLFSGPVLIYLATVTRLQDLWRQSRRRAPSRAP